MSRRAVTPSLEASQQNHIDDLVQRNRMLVSTTRKLEDDLLQEKNRAKATVQDIQNKLHAEKREWREACDTLQACHRIHQLRLQVELEKQRSGQLAEQELLRKEKVATLQREFAITRFQIQESLLERRVSELEDELEGVRQLSDEERQALKARISKLAAHLRVQEEQLNASEHARAHLEAELDELHKANAETQLSSESLFVKLERTMLHLDGERSRTADLEQANDELKRLNDELKRQVVKWQSLESKGDTEIETERKKRVELEVQLQAVQNQLAKWKEDCVMAEKRTEKAKQRLEDWKNHAESSQIQLDELKTRLAKSENVAKRLLSEVESAKKLRIAKDSPDGSEEEVANAVGQAAPSSLVPILTAGTSQRKAIVSNKPSSRQNSKGSVPPVSSSHSALDVNIDTRDISNSARAKGKGKSLVAEMDSNVEPEIGRSPKKPRPCPKPKAKRNASANDSDIEIIPQEDFTAGKGRKGKRKASPLPTLQDESKAGESNNIIQRSAPPVKRRKQNDDAECKPQARGGSKNTPPSMAESTASAATLGPESGGSSIQKSRTTKKRKINLFQSSGKPDLPNLDFGSQGSGIPSFLSPLKPEQAVPARSTSFLSILKR